MNKKMVENKFYSCYKKKGNKDSIDGLALTTGR